MIEIVRITSFLLVPSTCALENIFLYIYSPGKNQGGIYVCVEFFQSHVYEVNSFLWRGPSFLQSSCLHHCFTNHFDDPWLLIFHFGFRLEKQKALRLWSSPKLRRVFWTYGLITRIYLAEMYSTSDKVIFQPPKAQFFKTNSIDFYLFSNGFFSNPHPPKYYNFTFA